MAEHWKRGFVRGLKWGFAQRFGSLFGDGEAQEPGAAGTVFGERAPPPRFRGGCFFLGLHGAAGEPQRVSVERALIPVRVSVLTAAPQAQPTHLTLEKPGKGTRKYQKTAAWAMSRQQAKNVFNKDAPSPCLSKDCFERTKLKLCIYLHAII